MQRRYLPEKGLLRQPPAAASPGRVRFGQHRPLPGRRHTPGPRQSRHMLPNWRKQRPLRNKSIRQKPRRSRQTRRSKLPRQTRRPPIKPLSMHRKHTIRARRQPIRQRRRRRRASSASTSSSVPTTLQTSSIGRAIKTRRPLAIKKTARHSTTPSFRLASCAKLMNIAKASALASLR